MENGTETRLGLCRDDGKKMETTIMRLYRLWGFRAEGLGFRGWV